MISTNKLIWRNKYFLYIYIVRYQSERSSSINEIIESSSTFGDIVVQKKKKTQ